MKKLANLEQLILAVWVGSMIGVGYIAAPVLFSVLDDRKLAGSLAGEMFHIVTLGGLVCGGLMLLLRYRAVSLKMLVQWRGLMLLLMLCFVAGSMFVLQPMIAETKALGLVEGSEAQRKFGILHGISSLIYMLTVVCGCILIFMGLQQPEDNSDEFI